MVAKSQQLVPCKKKNSRWSLAAVATRQLKHKAPYYTKNMQNADAWVIEISANMENEVIKKARVLDM
jgi:hypothetical protein